MALFAGMGFTGRGHGKAVAGMAGGAGTFAAVQIDATDALVGPPGDDRELQFTGIRIPHFGFGDLEDGAMAVIAGIGLCIRIFGRDRELAVFALGRPQDRTLQLLVNGIVGEILDGMRHDVP